ncbi:anthranilate synthase component I family protein [soil metagenome]
MLLLNPSDENDSFEWMAAFGVNSEYKSTGDEQSFEKLITFLSSDKTTFGHFSYDLKNVIEKLHSTHSSGIDFPEICFFFPELIARKSKGEIDVQSDNSEFIVQFFQQIGKPVENIPSENEVSLKPRTTKEEYLSNVNSILQHIHRGDIYEMNYCIEFYAENAKINPVETFKKLLDATAAPFSVLYKYDDQWLLCASPERFLKKTGSSLISQPIKGTRPRGKSEIEDQQLKEELFNDPKERSENVMIVDLVRNDLSKSAKKGSVKVEELFGIHTFKNVHQMISTITAEMDENIHPVEAIKNAFPMGSMTGAPKIRAMELAEKFENMKRGLYSGAVGYFTPEMDFDFNVVIRSIQYNQKTGYLSIMVGSAITANSDPEKEYQECLLKAKTLFEALGLNPMP